jgi:hypothetical protein
VVKPSLTVFERVKQGGAECSVELTIIEFFLVIEKQDNLIYSYAQKLLFNPFFHVAKLLCCFDSSGNH